MIEKHQDRSCTKTSASGKLKWKPKTKCSSEAIILLKVKPSRYPKLETLAGTLNPAAFALPPTTTLKAFHADNDSLRLRTTSAIPWDIFPLNKRQENHDGVKWIAMKLMAMYAILETARQERKKA